MFEDILDYPLLLAIESGHTLIVPPSTELTTVHPYGHHERRYRDIETARLHHIYSAAVRNGMPACGMETLKAHLVDDFDISEMYDMFKVPHELVDPGWPKEMVDTQSTYIDALHREWTPNWNGRPIERLNGCIFFVSNTVLTTT